MKIGAGLLGHLGELCARPATQAVVVCDENVAPLYLERVRAGLEAADTRPTSVVLPQANRPRRRRSSASSTSVSTASASPATTPWLPWAGASSATSPGMPRRPSCAACGSSRRRRLSWPWSTPPSAARSRSISTRARTTWGRFYQPRLVVEDPDTLATLPEREVRGGWAEVVKHGLLAGGETLALTEASVVDAARPEPRLLEADVRFKAEVVAPRPARDDGRSRRAQLRSHGRPRHRGGRRLCPVLARRGRRFGTARRAVALRAPRGARPRGGRPRPGAAVGRAPARAARPASPPPRRRA